MCIRDSYKPSKPFPLQTCGQQLVVDIELSQIQAPISKYIPCLLYTSDAADERSSVDLGGRRIIKKKNSVQLSDVRIYS